ncbi:MAG: hypothetical protein ACP5MI_11675 [Candidatus Kryptoniota bacterium]
MSFPVAAIATVPAFRRVSLVTKKEISAVMTLAARTGINGGNDAVGKIVRPKPCMYTAFDTPEVNMRPVRTVAAKTMISSLKFPPGIW